MDRRQMLFDAVWEHWELYKLPPTIRWLRDETGISSTSIVQYWLKKLVEEGTLTIGQTGTGTRKVLSP